MREEDLNESSQRTFTPLEASPSFADLTIHQSSLKIPTKSFASKAYESLLTCLGALICPIGMCFSCGKTKSYAIIKEGYMGVQTRFGKVWRVVGPGLYFVNRLADEMHVVDVRVQSLDVVDQVVMTKDNFAFEISSTIYWRVSDILTAQFCMADVSSALLRHSMSSMCSALVAYDFQEFAQNKEILIRKLREDINATATSWGITVESILISNIKYSEEVRETLLLTTKEKKVGESRITAAKAEVETAKLMREATDMLGSSNIISAKALKSSLRQIQSTQELTNVCLFT
eukprot:TRINITY_DN2908_c0_g7_i1.p1 TRINITY_DN2908_c0_g7~~TRINITY_DN2908_c0_g7_i1.p1  ORF type:complete len:288 (-),score=40.63 TRINITY_DN2908_c0_g7_i1:96-959(-)